MTIENDLIMKSKQLVQQMQDAERQNKPIDKIVNQHINLLEEFHDVFVKKADRENYAPLDKVSGEVKIYSNMKVLAKKIGLPVEEYDKKIFELRCKIFSPDAVKQLFHDEG